MFILFRKEKESKVSILSSSCGTFIKMMTFYYIQFSIKCRNTLIYIKLTYIKVFGYPYSVRNTFVEISTKQLCSKSVTRNMFIDRSLYSYGLLTDSIRSSAMSIVSPRFFLTVRSLCFALAILYFSC